MKERVLVLEDDKTIREGLTKLLETRGFEVGAFSHPDDCPLLKSHKCKCGSDQVCTDFIISDLNTLTASGVDFLAQQQQRGCKVRNVAVMSGAEIEFLRSCSRKLDCHIFQKPFNLNELFEWLNEQGAKRDQNRVLSDWFL
jgi:DNA-binding NtrC family response regulator